jgi:hypothetical protein
LKGTQRTANVITEQDCEFLVIPANVMRGLATDYPDWNLALHTTIGERLSMMELPHGLGFDQQWLRELRTNQPEIETEPAPA